MLDVETLHHVALPVSDLARAKNFYGQVLGLTEIARPDFPFDGAWYALGDRQLHLIVASDPTFRVGKGVNSRDAHFAIRVRSFRRALEHLESKGYRTGHDDALYAVRVNVRGPTAFPQIHVMDPDRNMIEINAAGQD
jgi:glyoxylase I family protein